MNSEFEKFKALHHQPEPLLIGNVWNTQSARVFEKMGFKALATSSAAVAETLGYSDGEEMSFEEYFFVVKHIKRSVSIPLSVDLEAGYGADTEIIASNIKKLAAIGVAGINLEDSTVLHSKRTIADEKAFASRLTDLCKVLQSANVDMFVNVRSDTFLLSLPDAVNESVRRAKGYQATGIHGLFFPCIFKMEDIKAVVSNAMLPVNVMGMPGLPDFRQLQAAGVKRISMGNFVNKALYKDLEGRLDRLVRDGKFDSLF